MIKADRYIALVIWGECVSGDNANEKSDFAGCDLLDEVCGRLYIYNHPDEDDDYIWTSIGNLTNSERRRLIKGCIKIIDKYQSAPLDMAAVMAEVDYLKEVMNRRCSK